MTLPIVTSAEQVSKTWLTGALDEAGVARGSVVVGVTPLAVGTGQMGENVRFDLAWDDGDGRPGSVVAKFPSADPISRATGLATRSYEREVRFYQDVADTVDIRTPRCFYADVNTETGDFVLLMEDLAPRTQGDQLAGCTPDTAEAVLAQLARLQVPRWNDPTLHDIEWLSRRDATDSGALAGLYAAVLPGFVARLGGGLEPEELELTERFAGRVGDWAMGSPTNHLVVTHGDFRLDNMMFGSTATDPVAVVDWQGPGHGPPVADLAYFLGAGLVPEVRRSHEASLVSRYHEMLVEMAPDNSDVHRFTFAECWDGYRRAAFGGLVMAVVASQIVVETSRGDEMFTAMARRHATQALDLDAEALI